MPNSTLAPMQQVLHACCSFCRLSLTARPHHQQLWWHYTGCLPMRQRITYKLCTLMHAVVYSHGPQYLMDKVVSVSQLTDRAHLYVQLKYTTHSHYLQIEVRFLSQFHRRGITCRLTWPIRVVDVTSSIQWRGVTGSVTGGQKGELWRGLYPAIIRVKCGTGSCIFNYNIQNYE